MFVVGNDLFCEQQSFGSLEKVYQIVAVQDGIEAVKFLEEKKNEIKMVLFPLVPPRIDGYQILQYFKNHRKTNGLRLVAVTKEETYQTHLFEYAEILDLTVKNPGSAEKLVSLMENLLLAG